MITKLYIIASDSGDGSVCITFYENEDLARWVDERDLGSLGEPTFTEIEIESSDIVNIKNAYTPFGYLIGLVDEQLDTNEFRKIFFSDNPIPDFSLRREKVKKKEKYAYIDVIVGDEIAGRIFGLKSLSLEKVRNEILGPACII